MKWATVFLLAAMLAGCLDPGGTAAEKLPDPGGKVPPSTGGDPLVSTAPSPSSAPPAPPPLANDDSSSEPATTPVLSVVVADVGPGVNPYHAAFRRPEWTEHPSQRVPGLPADLPTLRLTLGWDFEESLAADQAVWAAYEPGVVHWVEGTNLLLLTLRSYSHIGLADGVGNALHGTQTAGAVNAACPECYVLVVQDWSNVDGGAMGHIADNLPWVAFATSTSFGYNQDEYMAGLQSDGYAKATRRLHDRGGLAFVPTGNGIVTPLGGGQTGSLHFINLPPWNVLVGGVYADCLADAVEASKPTEMVGNFAQILPGISTVNGTQRTSGVSFSTPQVAASFARAVLGLHQAVPGQQPAGLLWVGEAFGEGPLADGDLDAEELRAVMAATAQLFAATDFRPPLVCDWGPQTGRTDAFAPVSATPWVEMGWGYVSPIEADAAVAFLLSGSALPMTPEPQASYMDELADMRAAAYPW